MNKNSQNLKYKLNHITEGKGRFVLAILILGSLSALLKNSKDISNKEKSFNFDIKEAPILEKSNNFKTFILDTDKNGIYEKDKDIVISDTTLILHKSSQKGDTIVYIEREGWERKILAIKKVGSKQYNIIKRPTDIYSERALKNNNSFNKVKLIFANKYVNQK